MYYRILISVIGWALTALFVWISYLLEPGTPDMVAKAIGILVFMATLGLSFLAVVEVTTRFVFPEIAEHHDDEAPPAAQTRREAAVPTAGTRRPRRHRRVG